MAQMIEYECPCCGGSIEFDSTIQKMKCPYCDTEFDVEAMRALAEELKEEKKDSMEWTSSTGNEWQEEEIKGMRVYVCQSCGGEIIADENLGSTSCPYCGNNVVMKEQFAGDLKPDYIIPFKLDKRAAKEKLKQHFQGKKLLPKCFKDENHLEEIKGLYVPFWLFDAQANGEVRYTGTRVRVWKSGDYTYTKTSFYDILRAGSVEFANVPVDGSSKMPDELMQSLEPFYFSDAIPFEPAYLAGYLADRYDVSADESVQQANKRIKRSTEDALEETITGAYATKIPKESYVNLDNAKAKYALYPVWILTTKWRDQTFLFAMNGQTGKMTGSFPICAKRSAQWFLGIFAGASALLSLIFMMV